MLSRVGKILSSFRLKTVSGLVEWAERLKLNEWKSIEDYLRFATRKVWASWKACDVVAQVVQATPFKLIREGTTDAVKVPELQKLLQFPNARDTFADVLYVTVFHLKLTGWAFWLKVQPTLAGDRPRELWPLNPKRVRPVLSQQTGELIGWKYRVGSQDIPYTLDEVMVFRRPHPDNDIYGLGDYEAGEELISDFVNRQEWQKMFWKNGAAPSALMVLEESAHDLESFKRAKAAWMAEHGGRANSGKISWLTGKWKIERIGLTAQEMQDLEHKQFSIEQIFQLHGVPLTVAGIREAANYATAEIDDQRFRTYTVYPIVKIIADTMNTDLVLGWGEKLRIQFDVAGLVDIGKVVRDLTPLFDRGVVSLNEMRERAGFQRIDDNPLFDQHFISGALVPIELAGVADMGQTEEEADKTVRRFIGRIHAPQKQLPEKVDAAPIR